MKWGWNLIMQSLSGSGSAAAQPYDDYINARVAAGSFPLCYLPVAVAVTVMLALVLCGEGANVNVVAVRDGVEEGGH